MNRRLILTTFAFLIPLCAFAQKSAPKFGKVSKAEVEMSSYEKEPEAEALYIYDKKDVFYMNDFSFSYDVYVRIKIFSKEALDLGNVEIPYMSYGDSSESIKGLDANTYNMVDGAVVKTPMSKKNVFTDKVSDHLSVVKFSLPEVREGSVIEYKYTLNTRYFSRLGRFDIQHEYPVQHSLIDINLPEFIGYMINSHGLLSFDINQEYSDNIFRLGRTSYAVKRIYTHNDDVPSIREEPMVWCLDDFKMGFELEVSSIVLPEAQIFESYATDWASVNESLRKSELGRQQNARNPLANEVSEIKQKDIPETDKMREVLTLVRNRIKFDGRVDLMPNPPSKVVKDGIGSMADINNVLALALRDCGFRTDIILLNPRTRGRLSFFPSLNNIDTFIVCAYDSENNPYYMDATDRGSDLNVLDPNLLVDKARVYREVGQGGWVDLSHPAKNTDRLVLNAEFDGEGNIVGHLGRILTNQEAYSFNKQYNKADSEEDFIERESKVYKMELDSCTFAGLGTTKVIESAKFVMPAESYGDHIYIAPMLVEVMDENPFAEQGRKLPVEYSIISNTAVQFSMTLPEGYELEEAPQSCRIFACGGDVQFTFLSDCKYGKLMTRFLLTVNRVIFSAEEYADLSQLYAKAYELSNSRIVLKKSEDK